MKKPKINSDFNIMFLDIDGVLNCQLHYESKQFKKYSEYLANRPDDFDIDNRNNRLEYYKSQLCETRIQWLNELCKTCNIKVVISSTWRIGKTLEEMREILRYAGADFEVIDMTGRVQSEVRGVEIHNWLKDNCVELFGVRYFDFYRYVIVDDESDMLLKQRSHFFQTDNYSGLTPTTCHKIKKFLTHETF